MRAGAQEPTHARRFLLRSIQTHTSYTGQIVSRACRLHLEVLLLVGSTLQSAGSSRGASSLSYWERASPCSVSARPLPPAEDYSTRYVACGACSSVLLTLLITNVYLQDGLYCCPTLISKLNNIIERCTPM